MIYTELKILTPDIKLSTFTFMLFTLSGRHTRVYESSIILQLPTHLLTLTVYGQLVKDTHFIGPLELEANDQLKLSLVQALNNLIIFYLRNPNITLSCFFIKLL